MSSQRRGVRSLFVRIGIVLVAMLGSLLVNPSASYADGSGYSLTIQPGLSAGYVTYSFQSLDGRQYYFGIVNAVRGEQIMSNTYTKPYGAGDVLDNLYASSFTNAASNGNVTGQFFVNGDARYNGETFGDPGDKDIVWIGTSSTVIDGFFYINRNSGTVVEDKPPAPTGTDNSCILNDAALIRLARGAGVGENQLQISVAIALAESSGKMNALNYNESSKSWDIGPWQINDVYHPDYDRNLLASSPGYNASAMYAISSSGTNWSPWSTYKSGAYNKFMTRAAVAYQSAPSGTLGGNSCSDLSGGDKVPDPSDPSNPDDPDNPSGSEDCGFTINIFTILKCAFIPQNATGWKTQAASIGAKPPFSTVQQAVNSFQTFQTLYSICTGWGADSHSNGPCVAPSVDPQTQGNTLVGSGVTLHSFNPIIYAGDYMEDGKPAHFIYLMEQGFIYGLFLFWAWRRIARSLSSKDGADSNEVAA